MPTINKKQSIFYMMNKYNIEDISQQISEKGFVKIENIYDFTEYKFLNHTKKRDCYHILLI